MMAEDDCVKCPEKWPGMPANKKLHQRSMPEKDSCKDCLAKFLIVLMCCGPPSFLAGAILLLIKLSEFLALRAMDASKDFETLGTVCTVRRYEYYWETRGALQR